MRVYRADPGFRIVVDGITQFDTDRAEAIPGLAREAILARLRSYLPPRPPPPSDPDVVSTLLFDVGLDQVPAPAGARRESGEIGRGLRTTPRGKPRRAVPRRGREGPSLPVAHPAEDPRSGAQ